MRNKLSGLEGVTPVPLAIGDELGYESAGGLLVDAKEADDALWVAAAQRRISPDLRGKWWSRVRTR
jgi:hypothetical protein